MNPDRPLENSYRVVPGKFLAGEYPGICHKPMVKCGDCNRRLFLQADFMACYLRLKTDPPHRKSVN